jgi:hypothetical protein
MQTTCQISDDGLARVADLIFESGRPRVYSAYSEYGQTTKTFARAEELLRYADRQVESGEAFVDYAIHYPDTAGYVEDQKITLDPKRCKGHTFRYCLSGWGVIHLQCNFRHGPLIECRIAVNSEKRARLWADTYRGLKDPDLWNWKAVERHGRRLIRGLRKIAQEQVGSDADTPRNSR